MKINKNFLGLSILIFIAVLAILSYKVSWIIYIMYPLIITMMLFVLILDIISFKKVYYSKGKKLSIRVSYYRYIHDILFILLLILNFNTTDAQKHRSMFIILIAFFIIHLPIEYIKNSQIHFFESGIYIADIQINQKIIPYSKIEKLHFVEYLKGKFLLDIKLVEPFSAGTNNYKIKENDKEYIKVFINDFIEKEKVIETKEYKEDKLW